MKIAISGSSGLVGTCLKEKLQGAGHQIIPLVRGMAHEGEISWNPDQNRIEPSNLEGIEALIHLAGENIATVTMLK